MLTIKQLLDKIKWSGKFNPEEISVYYFDRIKKRNIKVKYKDIKIEGDYLIHEESQIPLHRVREVRKDGMIIWKGNIKN